MAVVVRPTKSESPNAYISQAGRAGSRHLGRLALPGHGHRTGSRRRHLRQPAAGPLNGVSGSGTAMVQVDGNQINVTMAASGLLPDMPHAAHIHFAADARHECPVAADDAGNDGRINTTDGAPAYGPVVVSLTKTGDTSPDSVLAVDRFDTAPGGQLSYQRGSITVAPRSPPPSPTASRLSSSTASTTTTAASTTAQSSPTSTRACPPRPPTRPCVASCSPPPPAEPTPATVAPQQTATPP